MGHSIQILQTPCGRFKKQLAHREGNTQKISSYDTYSLCDKPNLKITHKVCVFENQLSSVVPGTLCQNLPQRVYGF